MGLQDCAIHPDGPVAHALGSWRVDPTDAFWVELFRSICGFRDRRAGRAARAQGGPTASRRSGHVCETPGHGSGRVFGTHREFVNVAIDDCSRVAYVEILDDERANTAVGFKERAVAWFADHGVKVRRVMSDNGSCYIARDFAIACKRLRIKHLRTRPNRPQTNGKAERFIQTLQREWAYAAVYQTSRHRARALTPWVRFYNHRRPHGALGHQPPASRLRAAA